MDGRAPGASVGEIPPSKTNNNAKGPLASADDLKDSRKRGRPKEAKPKALPKEKARKTTKDLKQKVQRVDLDRQCGVPIVSSEGQVTGALCARSLTCKTHSMGAKRAVAGRSQPYDLLLAAYQQRNQLKSASGAAGAASKSRTGAASRAVAASHDSASEDETPLPDNEEISQVLRGAMMTTAQPLDMAVIVPTRLRSERVSLTEFLYKATSQAPPPPPASSPLAAIMASTQSMFGRCVVFERYSQAQTVRPSQIYAYERLVQRPQPDPRANAAHINQAQRMGASSPLVTPQGGPKPASQ